MSEQSFRQLLGEIKGRPVTHEECARNLAGALKRFAAETKKSSRLVAEARSDMQDTQKIIISLAERATKTGVPLSPIEMQIYVSAVHVLDSDTIELNSRQSEHEDVVKKVRRVGTLIEQLSREMEKK